MWRRLVVFIVVGLAGACWAQGARGSLPDGLYAEVTTAKGVIVMRLRPDAAPMAVASFVGLAEGTIANQALDPGQPFFDHSTFHRVVPGHVIQTGIPDSTRAKAPGYMFPNEIDARLSHDHAGAVGMANGGPGTNAAQWYITLGDRSYLDGDYTVFGEVVAGMDVVMQIRQGDALDMVRIRRVGKAAAAYHPTTASFQALVAAAKQRVARAAEQREAALAAWAKKYYPRATTPQLGAQPAPGPLRVSYRGKVVRYAGNWTHYAGPPIRVTGFASGPDGVPGFHTPPIVFDYTPGQTELNRGLEAALASMRPGERRTIVVPADLGYGKNGLYPPEVRGQPRFVISPNSLLIYDISVIR
jgi:peptidylprolyl isomerase